MPCNPSFHRCNIPLSAGQAVTWEHRLARWGVQWWLFGHPSIVFSAANHSKPTCLVYFSNSTNNCHKVSPNIAKTMFRWTLNIITMPNYHSNINIKKFQTVPSTNSNPSLPLCHASTVQVLRFPSKRKVFGSRRWYSWKAAPATRSTATQWEELLGADLTDDGRWARMVGENPPEMAEVFLVWEHHNFPRWEVQHVLICF